MNLHINMCEIEYYDIRKVKVRQEAALLTTYLFTYLTETIFILRIGFL